MRRRRGRLARDETDDGDSGGRPRLASGPGAGIVFGVGAAPNIPGYRFLEPLGRGGMAEVWLAERPGEERLLAVKRLLPKHLSHPTIRQRLVREAQIGALLDHRNIVKTVDAKVVDGDVFVATEYVPGVDLECLSHHLARMREVFPAGIVARIFVELLDGLHAAHEARGPDGNPLGVVHRDLSPRNVQLGFGGRVAIIDFGLARARVGQLETTPGAVIGTYRYMSPEQAVGEPVDRRSDLFSVGTSMYELFTGTWLFDAKDKADILSAIVHARLPPPSSLHPRLPPKLDAVILSALSQDRRARPATAAEMKESLLAAVPDWCDTPLDALSSLLEATFPEELRRARARLERVPKSEADRTREGGFDEGGSDLLGADTPWSPPPEMTEPAGRSGAVHRTDVVPRRGAKPAFAEAPELLSRGVADEDQAALAGRYDLIKRLGEGGMARAYLAHRLDAADLCVIKMLDPALAAGDPVQLRRFLREGEVASRLSHPGVARGFAVEAEGPRPYLEIEYVPGGNLAELAERQGGRLGLDLLLPVAFDLLEGLHAAHELRDDSGRPMGLVHRDISPQNLMISFAGAGKLIDFGVAHRRDEALTAVGAYVGKLYYGSPEQTLQQPLDRRTDIYSFGVSLYHLLTGELPIPLGLAPKDILRRVVLEPVPPLSSRLSSVPPGLDAVLARACEKDPRDRFADARSFRLALEAATAAVKTRSRDDIAHAVQTAFSGAYQTHLQLLDWVRPESTRLPWTTEPISPGTGSERGPRQGASAPSLRRMGGFLRGAALVFGGVGLGVALTLGSLERAPTAVENPASEGFDALEAVESARPTETTAAAAEPSIVPSAKRNTAERTTNGVREEAAGPGVVHRPAEPKTPPAGATENLRAPRGDSNPPRTAPVKDEPVPGRGSPSRTHRESPPREATPPAPPTPEPTEPETPSRAPKPAAERLAAELCAPESVADARTLRARLEPYLGADPSRRTQLDRCLLQLSASTRPEYRAQLCTLCVRQAVPP